MAMEAQRRQEVADRIRELRGSVPQPVIAERVGVTLRAYQAWEAGGGIGWENLIRLSKALGVSEEYLLYGDAGDERRAGTRLENVERGQRRLEAKIDALMEKLGVEVDEALLLDEVVRPIEELDREAEQERPAPARAGRGRQRAAPGR
jgi:hypothetical protein